MDLFPTGLDNSLFPAIFIGVLIAFAATETLGWTFTGLVVPGYLAAVALVSPEAAALMLGEALLSLALVRLLSDLSSRVRVGSRFFGRERFFLVLVVATGVRLICDHLLALEGSSAHSIGLVLVPLVTHALDKNGPLRGLSQIAVLTAITGAIVAGLIATTNLTLADLSLTFDDVAFAIDEHPKAYLVLLCGAFLAARANVAFGWDFHGIIVPGLLAVAWFSPAKVAVTFVEAMAALLLARGLMRLPGLRNMQLDGPRRLVLVFVADAILKLVLVGILGPQVPMLRPSDLYGFGYLLPALLADKMWQKMSLTRVLLPATQVSLGGFVLGNFLVWIFGRTLLFTAPAAIAAGAALAPPPVPAERALALSRAGVARDDEKTRLSSSELRRWDKAMRAFAGGADPAAAFAPLADAGASIVTLEGNDGVLVRENAPTGRLRGLGTIWARPAGARVIVAVPRPLDGDLTLVAGDVARALDARALIVSGRPDAAEPLALLPASKTPYVIASRAFERAAWVELIVDDSAPTGGVIDVGPATWPEAVNLEGLRGLLPGLTVRWSGDGRAVRVVAPQATWRELAARPCAASADEVRPWPETIDSRRFEEGLEAADRLLYAESVVAPLALAARGRGRAGATSACRAAQALGLQVQTLLDSSGERHLAVMPASRWASPVFLRADGLATAERIITAPRARVEPWTDRAALLLYRRLDARALLLGAPAATRLSSSHDAAVEALTATLGTHGAEAVVLEVRGGSLARGAVLSWGGLAGEPARVPEWIVPLERALASVGLPAERYDGRPEHACCGDLENARRTMLSHVGRARVAAVYLSRDAREARFLDGGATADMALAAEVGLPTGDQALLPAVKEALAGATCDDTAATTALARRWAELRHIADLHALAERRARVVRDPVSGEVFVVAASRCREVASLGVISLRDPDAGRPALEVPVGAPLDPILVEAMRWGRFPALVATQMAVTVGNPAQKNVGPSQRDSGGVAR